MKDFKALLRKHNIEMIDSIDVWGLGPKGPFRVIYKFRFLDAETKKVLLDELIATSFSSFDYESLPKDLDEESKYDMIKYRAWNIISCLMKKSRDTEVNKEKYENA